MISITKYLLWCWAFSQQGFWGLCGKKGLSLHNRVVNLTLVKIDLLFSLNWKDNNLNLYCSYIEQNIDQIWADIKSQM